MAIRAVIADADEASLLAMAETLKRIKDISCVGCYQSARELLEAMSTAKPDVALIDLGILASAGVECLRRMNAMRPALRAIVVTGASDLDDDLFFGSLSAGAGGYVVKTASVSDWEAAIRVAFSGGMPLSELAAQKLVRFFQSIQLSSQTEERLTPAEREVLASVLNGAEDKEVATHLGVAVTTVHSHLHNIFEKLSAGSREAAVRKYFGLE
jgi:DNA-binding NarL/FixJ family response regulator